MIKRCYALLAASMLIGAALLHCAPDIPHAAPHTAATASAQVGQTVPSEHILFPDLLAGDVTRVSLVTPQVSYDLRREDSRLISINGRHADREAFSTLLDQIAGMRYTAAAPFSSRETPLLTLMFRQNNKEYSAEFYSDNSEGEYARIISSRDGTIVYGLMDGWRVGTLMLACEGMRIQDESGNETPME